MRVTFKDLTQSELDEFARFICEQNMSQKDKEMLAMEFCKKYKVENDLRFRRMATIPGIDEDL